MRPEAVIIGPYRYVLTRPLTATPKSEVRVCNFIMLNPSTADANVDDPTIRRCKGFAMEWEYDLLVVTNLFALRSPDPASLRTVIDPVGPENDKYVLGFARTADLVLCAWGSSNKAGRLLDRREEAVSKLLAGIPLFCLKHTDAGHPVHPLYQPAYLKPSLWRRA